VLDAMLLSLEYLVYKFFGGVGGGLLLGTAGAIGASVGNFDESVDGSISLNDLRDLRDRNEVLEL